MVTIDQGILYQGGIPATKFENVGVTYKSDDVRKKETSQVVLKIQLGKKCNYNCAYCLQDINPTEKRTGDVHTLISNIDLSETKKIELWGGEPLLYLSDIYTILDMVDTGIEIMIITNISLLTPDILRKLNSFGHKINLGLSHDGPEHSRIRGKLSEDSFVEALKTISKLSNINYSINIMLSTTNYKMVEIDMYFKQLMEKNSIPFPVLYFELIESYDASSAEHTIPEEKHVDFENELCRYVDYSKDGYSLQNNIYHYSNKSLEGVKRYLLSPYRFSEYGNYKCDIDNAKVKTVDLDGNIKICQNTSENLEDESLVIYSECQTCRYNYICTGVCPIIDSKDYFYKVCGINKVYAKTIENTILFELSKKIEEQKK